MAVNQSGIAISIKAFLPTGKSMDEMFNALSLVKAAHETGDYSDLLKAAQIDEIKTEQKTRRIEVAPEPKPEGDGVMLAQLFTTTNPILDDAKLIPTAEPDLNQPAEAHDDGLAVVESNDPLPWADEAPAEEAKPKGKKKAE